MIGFDSGSLKPRRTPSVHASETWLLSKPHLQLVQCNESAMTCLVIIKTEVVAINRSRKLPDTAFENKPVTEI